MNFFTFLHGLICDSINDKESKNWLPKIMNALVNEETGQKSFPLKVDCVDAGEIKENYKKITDLFGVYWWSLVEFDSKYLPADPPFNMDLFCPIANPKNPYPRLMLTNLVIDGLTNTRLEEEAKHEEQGSGYKSVMKAQLNAYEESVSVGEKLSKLNISGDYRINLSLCAAEKINPTVSTEKQFAFAHISWPVQDIECKGTFSIMAKLIKSGNDPVSGEMKGPFVKIEIRTEQIGSGSGRGVKETVDEMSIVCETGTQVKFVVDKEKLTGKSDLSDWFVEYMLEGVAELLESPDAGVSLLQSINNAFKDHLEGASESIEGYILQGLDSIYGALPAGGLPVFPTGDFENKVDQYLFDRLRVSLNDPQSDMYLSWFILSSTPTLEPYKVDKVPLDSFDIGSQQFTDVELNNLQVEGLSNALLEGGNATVVNEKIDLKIDVSKLVDPPTTHGKKAPPPPLMIKAKFHAMASGVAFDGDFTVQVRLSRLHAIAVIDAFGGSDFKVTVEQLVISVASQSDVNIKVNLGTIFDALINAFLNGNDTVLKSMINKLNDTLRSNLKDIGTELTKEIRRALKENLKG